MSYTTKCAKCRRTIRAINLEAFEKPDWTSTWVTGKSKTTCKEGGLHDPERKYF